MPLPTSGPLTISQIQGQFGGANPTSLTEYYANGAYVPAGTEGINGPIPESGEISFSDFYGAPVSPVEITSRTVSDVDFSFGPGPATANAYYSLRNSGQLTGTESGGVVVDFDGEWLTSGVPSDYEARATAVSGLAVSGGTIGSWLGLGTTRTWSRNATASTPGAGVVIKESTILVEIRRVSDSVVVSSATILLHAEAEYNT